MRFPEDDDVIEALPANAPNDALNKRILPWTLRSSDHFVDIHSFNPVAEMATVNSVTIPDQIAGCPAKLDHRPYLEDRGAITKVELARLLTPFGIRRELS